MKIKILSVIILFLLIGFGCKGQQTTKDVVSTISPDQIKDMQATLERPLFFDSKKGGFIGVIEAKGYLKVEEKDCSALGLKECANNKYAYFKETNTDNIEVLNLIFSNKDKFYFGPYAIGLGCWEKERIYAKNFADDKNSESIIQGDQFQALQSSNKERLITIKMIVPVNTSKNEPQDLCYSRVRSVEVK
ncbi:hypothetical protein HZA39_04415 [Candidatus Peregrinibacteria bacterium]|nr:hypothetical protein [Candidatus Peregrinibacteria bacterium]